MSTLVLASQLNIQTAEGSALMLAAAGALAAEDLDLDLGLDLAEHNDLAGVLPDVPMIKADSGAGVFLEPDQDARQAPSELVGLILARQGSKVFFPPRERLLEYAKGVGFKHLLSEKLKWICRNANRAKPGEAELNPQLTPEQIEEAKTLKLGGATGTGCIGCPANSWYDPGDGQAKMRLCKDGENLIWLDSKKEEPVVLSVIAASSVVELEKYLKTCFSKGKPLPLFRHLVKISFQQQKSDKPGVKPWYALQITNLQALEKDTMVNVATAYKSQLFLLERASKRVDNMDGAGFGEPEAMDGTPTDGDAPTGGEQIPADVLGGVL